MNVSVIYEFMIGFRHRIWTQIIYIDGFKKTFNYIDIYSDLHVLNQ